MNKIMTDAIEQFANLLERRFNSGVFTTEDSVRYTFFASLSSFDIAPEHIILEYPHPSVLKARIDMVILSNDLQPCIAIEFKYDRAIPSGKPLPLPARAGDVFKDFVRLLQWQAPLDRYLIYLTDKEPGTHSGLSLIFSLEPGQRLMLTERVFVGYAPTFSTHMGTWPMPAILGRV